MPICMYILTSHKQSCSAMRQTSRLLRKVLSALPHHVRMPSHILPGHIHVCVQHKPTPCWKIPASTASYPCCDGAASQVPPDDAAYRDVMPAVACDKGEPSVKCCFSQLACKCLKAARPCITGSACVPQSHSPCRTAATPLFKSRLSTKAASQSCLTLVACECLQLADCASRTSGCIPLHPYPAMSLSPSAALGAAA